MLIISGEGSCRFWLFSDYILGIIFLLHRYDYYSFSIIPAIGELVAGDRESYQYLVESIRRFPTQVNSKSISLLCCMNTHINYDDTFICNTPHIKHGGEEYVQMLTPAHTLIHDAGNPVDVIIKCR